MLFHYDEGVIVLRCPAPASPLRQKDHLQRLPPVAAYLAKKTKQVVCDVVSVVSFALVDILMVRVAVQVCAVLIRVCGAKKEYARAGYRRFCASSFCISFRCRRCSHPLYSLQDR